MKREQGILIGTVIAAIIMMFLCSVFTFSDAVSEKALTTCIPESVSITEDGKTQYDFNLKSYGQDIGSIVFYSSHQRINVYAQGEQIYRLSNKRSIWGNTPGWTWNFVKLPSDVDSLQIEISPCYKEVEGQKQEFYIGGGNDIYMKLLRKAMPAFIISVVILLVGLYITIYWTIVHKGSQIDGTLLYLGIFSILLGLWSANETDVSALIFANRQAGAYIAFVTLMIMPMAFIMFVKSFLEINDNLFWKLICYFNVTIILLEHILNATGMYYFRQTLWMTHIVIILMLIYLFVVITIKIIRRQLDTRYKYCILALILVFLSTIIDMAGYYKNGNDSGVFGRIAFLLFILVLGLEASRQAVARLKKGRRIEELEQFALNDSMTGMYNRNAYDYYINNEKCFDDCMVVTFDLNNLKNCNDNYGHRAGDAYIINAARIIENTFERYGKCYRIGGDEFCCIIPKGKSVDIERVIRKLYHDVDVLNNKRIIPTEVGIAYGYAVFKVDDTELEKVRERADEEMYQRKKEMKM